jgi:hypothetical protein
MTIGLDLDNTIVCYDRCFHALAVERCAMPEAVPVEKTAVRQFLREAGREAEWTELQGIAYGVGMGQAGPFVGALNFVRDALQRGRTLKIISHRTLHPIVGDQTDLHACALEWLKLERFVGPEGLHEEDVFFETIKEAKLARIASQQCDVFLDDLTEILSADRFPASCQGWLFNPAGSDAGFPRVVADWNEFAQRVL